MPAAAVIPAPIAYIKVVAVKKLVVEFRARTRDSPFGDVLCFAPYLLGSHGALH